jgi:glycosyltransferase involved in cell wall biosynthesis/peptidoglycan/xylan/chitin deacetylase (PgdA/CDA1 family)
MLRQAARSMLAAGLRRSGADRVIGRYSGVATEPLVLGYHRVFEGAGPDALRGVPSMGIRASTLRKHLEFVARSRRFVSLDELGDRLEQGTARNLAVVTFDDGYIDFYENAFPLLQKMGIPAAVFVVTDLVDSASGFVHDRLYDAIDHALARNGVLKVRAFLAEAPFAIARVSSDPFKATRAILHSLGHEALLKLCDALDERFGRSGSAPRSMSWAELSSISRAGVIVGSHTRTHSLLTRETAARVVEETAASRRTIESRLGVSVRHFVYPDGCFDNAAVRAVAAAGYRFAYTGCRHRDAEHPLLTLPRRVLWEGSTRGAIAGFSPDILSAQLQGVFDFAQRCTEAHGAQAAPAPERIRIAVVAPSLNALGGQSIQASAITEGLHADGFNVSFIPTDPSFPEGLAWARRVPVLRTVVNQLLYAWSLPKLRHADVVHVFSASFWSFLLAPVPAMAFARVFGRRIVLNYHSGEAEEHLKRWGALVHPWLRLADEIVVPSQYLHDVFARHGHFSRVVPNVVDTQRFTFSSRIPLRPRLLSTRNLEVNYRVDIVLEAFARVRREHRDATLVVAGSGSEENRLRRMAESIGGVTFTGRVDRENMPSLCAAADVFLNASVVDNQPLSLLEAFASGLPVVTTSVGGISEMVRHGESGLVVPTLDAPAMAAAVDSLLRDADLTARVTRGGLKVVQAHSWAGVRDQWAEVYSGHPKAPVSDDPLVRSRALLGLRAAMVALSSALWGEPRC